jgi:hypothetical protein
MEKAGIRKSGYQAVVIRISWLKIEIQIHALVSLWQI